MVSAWNWFYQFATHFANDPRYHSREVWIRPMWWQEGVALGWEGCRHIDIEIIPIQFLFWKCFSYTQDPEWRRILKVSPVLIHRDFESLESTPKKISMQFVAWIMQHSWGLNNFVNQNPLCALPYSLVLALCASMVKMSLIADEAPKLRFPNLGKRYPWRGSHRLLIRRGF